MGRLPECDVCLEAGGISRVHARILVESDGFYLEDLKSRNGTFLNECQTVGKVKLHEGDIIRLCDSELVFYAGEPYIPGKETKVINSDNTGVYLDDAIGEDDYAVKAKIQLYENRPNISPGNAAVKLQAMIDIGRHLGAGINNVLMQLVTNLLKILPQADCAFILLKNEQTGRLDVRAYKHRYADNQENFRLSRTILEKVANSRAAILSEDVKNDPRFDVSESIVNYNIYSMMATPIMDYDGAETFGVIEVDARSTGNKFLREDLDLLIALGYQVAIAIQNVKLQEVAVHDQMLDREMTIANSVQRGLLPSEPPVVKNYSFYDFYRPAKYLAGDYYDYIPLPDGRIVFALGDVSGKGVPASLLMAKLSSEVRSCLIIESRFENMVKRINKIFSEPRWDNRFITFFFGILDPKTNEIVFHNAGHVPPILVTQSTGTVEMLGENNIGLPLGVMDDTEYPETRFTIQNGQKLLIISDGITDAMNSQDKYFTMEGVIDYLKKTKTVPVVDFGQNFINAVESFSGHTPQTDDQSLIVLGRIDEE